MSFPPPPGTSKPNLPAKPPASIHAFASFAPRSVRAPVSNVVSAAPQTYGSAPGVISNGYSSGGMSYGGYNAGRGAGSSAGYASVQSAGGYQSQQAAYAAYQAPIASAGPVNYNSYDSASVGGTQSTAVHPERRQFVPRQHQNQNQNTSYPPLDPELEAQIAEQQSIYDPSKRALTQTSTTSENYIPPTDPQPQTNGNKKATVVRSGGGETWKDDSLLEWDPAHFRLFVGNLAGEVTDESLLKAFSAYTSVQRARVIRDKRTTKSKGYGFVAFQDGDDYFKAAREMQGKYIGSHPILLRKSTTEIKAVVPGRKGGIKNSKNYKGKNERGVLGKQNGGGVKKKEKGPKLLG